MADTQQQIYDEIVGTRPELLWLRRPDGSGSIFAGTPGRPETAVTGNLMPFVDLSIGEIPLFNYPNQHILNLTHNTFANTITLSLIDPTNFIIERLMRFTFTTLNARSSIKIRYGWTNGVSRWGTDYNDWLVFTINGLSQSIELDGTRWTMTLVPYMKSYLDNVHVKENANLDDATPDRLQDWINGVLSESGDSLSIAVKMLGKFQKTSNVESGGRYQTPGNLEFKEVLDAILKTWQTTSGQLPKYSLDPFCSNFAATNGGKPYTPLFIWDEEELLAMRKKEAQTINQAQGNNQIFGKAHIFSRWPSTDGSITKVQMVSDLNWLAKAKVKSYAVDAGGRVVEQQAEIATGKINDLTGHGQTAPNADIVTEPGTAMSSPTGEPSSAERGIIKNLSDAMTRYTSRIEVTTMGEPYFISTSRFKNMLFGLLIDDLFNLERTVPPFRGNDAASLAQAFPFLGDPRGTLAQKAAGSGLFDPESTGAWLTGLYTIMNVIQSISGGSFTTNFTLFMDTGSGSAGSEESKEESK